MFNKKNKITFCAHESSQYLPTPYPAYKEFPKWFIESNRGSTGCPFMSLIKYNKISGDFKPPHPDQAHKIVKNSTVKNCPGIVDYLKTGYVLPAWTDFTIRHIKGKMLIDSACITDDMHYGLHRNDQFLGMDESQLPEMGMFHKMSSPWWIKTSPGVSIWITDPYWERNKSFTSVSAVVHPDQSPIKLKWFFELNQQIKNDTEIYDESIQVVKKGTPLLLMIPFRRESFTHDFEYLEESKLLTLKKQDEFNKTAWFSESTYDKFRKTFNIWFR
jgi:hypothetical protein